MEMTERFLDDLDTLVNESEELESEIESYVETLEGDEVAHFLYNAGRVCDMLGCIVANLMSGDKVSIQITERAAVASAPAGSEAQA